MDLGKMISKHRGAIMGLSAALIVCFHSYWKPDNLLWKYLINLRGNLGVDFFVFLAGFGVVFSIEKDSCFSHYYKKRLVRILPSYYVALTVMLAAYAFAGKLTMEWTIANYIPVGMWINGSRAYWYVQGTLVYYVLAYMFYYLIRSVRQPRIVLVVTVFITGVLLPSISSIPKVAELRVPVLMMGVAMGVFSTKHTQKKDRILDLVLFAGFFAAGIVVDQVGMLYKLPLFNQISSWKNRLHKALIAPLLVFVLAYLFELIGKTPARGCVTFFEKLGRYSLEIYLSHPLVRSFARDFLKVSPFYQLLLMLIFSYPLAVCISWVGKKLLSLLKRLPIFAEAA